MIEKAYLGLILILFILAFAIKNIKTYVSIKKSIRGKSVKLTISVLISTLIYCLILLRLTILQPQFVFEINLPEYLNTIGLIMVSIGFTVGILALIAMKNSWRVGIKQDQSRIYTIIPPNLTRSRLPLDRTTYFQKTFC